MSAGERFVFSAKICDVDPRTTCRTGPAGATATAAGAGTAAGAATAGTAAGGAAAASAARRLLGGRGRSLGSGLRLRFGLRSRLRRRLHHLPWLRGLRRLPAGRTEPRNEVLGHARGGGLPRHPHLLERLQQLLAGDLELFRELVDPHASCNASSMSFLSLASSSWANPERNALASAPRRNARSMHRGSRCTYAPRPGARPSGSTRTPSGDRATRSSSAFGARSRQPTHDRSGSPAMAHHSPAGASAGAAGTASCSASGVGSASVATSSTVTVCSSSGVSLARTLGPEPPGPPEPPRSRVAPPRPAGAQVRARARPPGSPT